MEAAPLGWTADPWIAPVLLVSGLLYLVGMVRDRFAGGSLISPGQAGLFWTGFIVLTLALTSPLHALGERMFTAHMIEHALVITVAAPLLVLGRPDTAWATALGRPAYWPGSAALAGAGAALTYPVTATLAHGAAIWVWHLPGLLDASVLDPVTHRWQHAWLLLTALLFWWSLLRRADPAIAAAALFATMIHTGILGALIAMAPRVLYPAQTAGAMAFCGLNPLEDQQLAGLVMWVPSGIVYAAAALACLGVWIRASGRRFGSDHVLP